MSSSPRQDNSADPAPLQAADAVRPADIPPEKTPEEVLTVPSYGNFYGDMLAPDEYNGDNVRRVKAHEGSGMMTGSALHQAIQGLNPAQSQAVQEEQRHVLVSAGAGTGKTRVLTLRYAYLVKHFGLDPAAIMAVTFTNKASHEMRHRLQAMLPVHKLWIGTFHSLGLRILRQNPADVGRVEGFSILDVSDQTTLIQKLMKERAVNKAYTPRMVAQAISAWKQALMLPEEVTHAKTPFYLDLYRDYQDQLQRMNCFDFDDLVMASLRLIRHRGDIVQDLGFAHVLVDEYQDINEMQYQWLKVFADHGAYLFCVGDDDQSIYGWRGASIDKILRFPGDFTGANVVYLEDNYRSTLHILSAASHLIAHNQERYGKVLRTDQTTGEKVQIQGLWDSTEEAAFVTDLIVAYARDGLALKNMAILVRTSAQTREFEERLTLQHVPYHLVGSTRFYDRMEIRDVVAYLRLLQAPTDNLAFERVVNVPKRGIGATTLKLLYSMVSAAAPSLEQAARRWCSMDAASGSGEEVAEDGGLVFMAYDTGHEQDRTDTTDMGGSVTVKRAMRVFLQQVDGWRNRMHQNGMPPVDVAQMVVEESGYAAYWQTQGVQGQTRMDNVKELIKAMHAFGSLSEFLEHVSLLADVTDGAEQEGVALMTIHAAKGLEFDTVFLPGWEEHVFPHIRSIEESGKKGVEEERRLAYVALTRARHKSHITFCWNRRGHQGFIPSSPSRFINELPASDVVLQLKIAHTSARAAGGGASTQEPSQRVVHAVFGKGVIQSQAGDMVCVLFERHGIKKVVARFLNFLR